MLKEIMLLSLIINSLVFTKKAHAYIDPGAGSYLLQILVAAAMTLPFLFRNNIKNFLDRFKRKDSQENQEENE